jgi:hypothetical protein
VNGGILGVELTFKEPVLKVKLGGKEFWIRDDEHFLEIKEGLLIGAETFVIDTPQYLTGTTSLSWFFYEIPLETFIKIVPLIHAEIPNIVRFVYLAGSPRLALFTDNGQTIYLNITNSEALQEQFKKYHTLQEHYENFGKLGTIDLGSLDESKTIVR